MLSETSCFFPSSDRQKGRSLHPFGICDKDHPPNILYAVDDIDHMRGRLDAWLVLLLKRLKMKDVGM